MRKYVPISLILTFTLMFSCNSEDMNKIKYHDSIKGDVLEILDKRNPTSMSFMYDNKLLIKEYEDDSLTVDTFENERDLIFRSTHRKENDIIIMEGSYGVFGGYGYTIIINGEKVEVFYTISSNEVPEPYSLNIDDQLTNFIQVPAKSFSIELSNKPKGIPNEIVYGIIKFESEDYYKMDYQKLHKRKKINTSMKIYFRSIFRK